MRVINGFSIVSWKERSDGAIVVLAAREGASFEYVTAIMFGLDAKEWYWGNYFNAFDYSGGKSALDMAVASFNERVTH